MEALPEELSNRRQWRYITTKGQKFGFRIEGGSSRLHYGDGLSTAMVNGTLKNSMLLKKKYGHSQ
jgi:hypothetical protein